MHDRPYKLDQLDQVDFDVVPAVKAKTYDGVGPENGRMHCA